jgi:hypothetical protein
MLLLGALEGKFVIGSMSRGGIGGLSFESDDPPLMIRARFRGTAGTAARCCCASIP